MVAALHLTTSIALASTLLKELLTVNALDDSKTGLAGAMDRGLEEAVEFLVANGADLRLDHGRSILLHVTERNWHNAGKVIDEQAECSISADDTPVVRNKLLSILATYRCVVKQVRRLVLQEDFDLKSQDRTTGEIALFLVIELQYPQIVQILLDAGVDINAKDNTGKTALHRATRREDRGMVELLLRNGAKVDCKDDKGWTAWSANVQSRNAHILGLLLKAGADPSTRGLQGVSELYTAAKGDDT
ncbi:MAG: hypothetical protein M1840_006922 [Geoglossum simile]|nr:MAG: hypothetical protein M1840_006922 [Geoglossum simile]